MDPDWAVEVEATIMLSSTQDELEEDSSEDMEETGQNENYIQYVDDYVTFLAPELGQSDSSYVDDSDYNSEDEEEEPMSDDDEAELEREMDEMERQIESGEYLPEDLEDDSDSEVPELMSAPSSDNEEPMSPDEDSEDDDWLDEMAHEIEVLEEEARNLLAMDLDS